MKKQPTYSTFKARVYKVTCEKKIVYVYYEWKPENGARRWTKTDKNGKPFRWAVPGTDEGSKAYHKFVDQLDDSEVQETDNGANIFPPVEFDVTMKREHRGQYTDEYVWTFSHRTTPMPEFVADIFVDAK